LVKWSQKYFTKLSKNIVQKPQKSSYCGGVFKKEKDLEQINYILGFESFSYHHKDYYKSQILSMILGGGMSSRLFQEVREKNGLVYSIYSFNSCFADSGTLGIYCATTQEKCDRMIKSISKEINKICEKINTEELDRIKTQFKASLKMAKESTSSRMQRLGSDIILFNKTYSDDQIIDKFKDITKKEIIDIAQKIFSTKPTTAMIGKISKIKENIKIS
jgi:predicted Zn-dependent peptidase